jgi:antitoxin component HigA of HigAB toxin-antitoxin module
MLQYLMEHRGLRQADLLPIFGSRFVAFSSARASVFQPSASGS